MKYYACLHQGCQVEIDWTIIHNVAVTSTSRISLQGGKVWHAFHPQDLLPPPTSSPMMFAWFAAPVCLQLRAAKLPVGIPTHLPWTLLNKAVAALPHALWVEKAVLEMEAEDIYHILDRIQELCTVKLTDSRFTTHYAIITACTLQVSGSFRNVGCKFVL